ncbi:hypothetical protein IV38_GL000699 [Lactobacillus selangorensis]|uniref:N-acetyltransferase domain-containing protein n=1 Tax=Lactobacillus selangorensis TaxID=81857 RepID=A0A0R2FRF7_9LACO|nr:GNAT family N-acetyltransferase [Lactobacillus selangorensis]KRN27293.1 hypothetical protein IV38_GL000699 [Lactobacillus selangorensis]KRN29925.1 hypothetical protein IV40_GL000523 [Lactobacillus selangorensis]
MTIRTATLRDIGPLSQLKQQLVTQMHTERPDIYQEHYEADFFAEQARIEDSQQLVLVAEINGQVGGFSQTFTTQTPQNDLFVPQEYAYLAMLYVAPAFRRHGAASEMVRQTQRWTHKQQLAYLELSVLQQNATAQKLYAKLHFKPVYQSLRWEAANENTESDL